MKKCLFLLMVLFLSFSTLSYSQMYASLNPASTSYEQIESNYLEGLNSDVHSLKLCCAYFLGEMKSQKALIPLMEIFRNAENDGAKLVAAWSLLKIGDPRGVYLVKSAIDDKKCDNISCMLHFLYTDYCLKTNGKIDRS